MPDEENTNEPITMQRKVNSLHYHTFKQVVTTLFGPYVEYNLLEHKKEEGKWYSYMELRVTENELLLKGSWALRKRITVILTDESNKGIAVVVRLRNFHLDPKLDEPRSKSSYVKHKKERQEYQRDRYRTKISPPATRRQAETRRRHDNQRLVEAKRNALDDAVNRYNFLQAQRNVRELTAEEEAEIDKLDGGEWNASNET